MDLETKSYSRTPQSNTPSSNAVIRRLESRIEELTTQLAQVSKDKSRASLSRDRDAIFKLAESDRQKSRLEEEIKSYEEKVTTMRKAMDEMVSHHGLRRDNSYSHIIFSKQLKGSFNLPNDALSAKPQISSRSL